MKAELAEDEIHVFWQPRHTVEDGYLCRWDANGNIEYRVPVAEGRYDVPYRLAGVIPVVDATVDFCGLKEFNDFLFGIMRHVVCLIIGGWGDTPEEVVGWFQDLSALEFLQESEYKVIGPEREPFIGIQDTKIHLAFNGADIVAYLTVKEARFEHVMEGNADVTAFVISTIPAV